MPSPPGQSPEIRALTQRECTALLGRHSVGRIAFTFHDRVDIQPLNYVYEAGWIYGRTSDGGKLATLAHHPWVAFEVDEVRGPFDWASVVVHGSFHPLDPDRWQADAAVEARTLSLLRQLVPETFTPDDPAPARNVLFRIAVGDMTGRLATPGGGEPA